MKKTLETQLQAAFIAGWNAAAAGRVDDTQAAYDEFRAQAAEPLEVAPE